MRLVTKTRTEMPYAVCPQCNRSTTVGKLSGGETIVYYCRECYLEFKVKRQKKKITCDLTFRCGMRVTPSDKFVWQDDRWVKR